MVNSFIIVSGVNYFLFYVCMNSVLKCGFISVYG